MTTASTHLDLPALLKLLSDETRLRVLGLAALQELGVGELAEILAISSSRLANHLRLLREAELILDRKEGTWRFVRLNRRGGLPQDLWKVVEAHLEDSPRFAADRQRLDEILEERRARSRDYFDGVASDWDSIGSDFETGSARQRAAAGLLDPQLVVADVGAGTGHLSSNLVGMVKRVILIDHSPAMLEQARVKLGGRGSELEFRRGELDDLPLEDEEVDGIVAGMVLHHVPDPREFFMEAFRVLRPKGRLVVQDLLPHRETWLRDAMADLRLGLDPEELSFLLAQQGFVDLSIETLDDCYCPPRPEGGRARLPLFLLRACKRAEPKDC